MKIDIYDVQKGDIVRFKTYALRVEQEPVRNNGSITLHGRKSTEGSPLVTKRFLRNQITVEVERGAGT